MFRNSVQKFAGSTLLALCAVACTTSLPALAADPSPTGAYALASKLSTHPREVIEYDAKSRVSKDMIIPAWGVNKGLKIVAYYPGSKKIRMKAVGDWTHTVATYYRRDKTRDCVLTVFGSAILADWYDATGAKLIISQVWLKTGDGAAKERYRLYSVRQMDGATKPLREYWPFQGSDFASDVTVYNVKIPGDLVFFRYRDDRTLDSKTYLVPHEFAVRKQSPSPTDALSAPPIPAELMRVPTHLEEDEFPEIPQADYY